MVASRRLNVSSAPRFFSKLLARNIAITAGTAGVESRAVNGAVISVAMTVTDLTKSLKSYSDAETYIYIIVFYY
ncbi:MAG: hypothetical protein QXW39_08145 [Candidatus Bathyarchaeia archaeon]